MSTDKPVVRVDIASDVVCPWCVIGFCQLAKAATQQGVLLEVHWHPFELNPRMAEEGENTQDHVAAKYGATREASLKSRQKLTELGAELGFTFNYNDESRMWNTFRAHQLIDYAEEFGRAHEMKIALFTAHFTDGRNISDISVLTDIAAGLGFDRDEVERTLQMGVRAGNVRQKQEVWIDNGIAGVPAMIFAGKHLVVGAQGVENYSKILDLLTERAEA